MSRSRVLIDTSCALLHKLLFLAFTLFIYFYSTLVQTGHPARFDFEGNILAVDVDVPVNLGLHHHGEEPEVGFGGSSFLSLLNRKEIQTIKLMFDRIHLCNDPTK